MRLGGDGFHPSHPLGGHHALSFSPCLQLVSPTQCGFFSFHPTISCDSCPQLESVEHVPNLAMQRDLLVPSLPAHMGRKKGVWGPRWSILVAGACSEVVGQSCPVVWWPLVQAQLWCAPACA